MTRPTLLDFVPRKKRFQFGLRALLLFTACVGPVALLASVLPARFYISVGPILVLYSVGLVAWFVSYARLPLVAAFFVAGTAISVILVTSVIVAAASWGIISEAIPATACVSVFFTISSGLGYGLSWSRHAG